MITGDWKEGRRKTTLKWKMKIEKRGKGIERRVEQKWSDFIEKKLIFHLIPVAVSKFPYHAGKWKSFWRC